MQITAINKKNQALVNKAVKWLVKHNEANCLRDIADSTDDNELFIYADKLCQKTFDSYLEITAELPKREIAQIEKILY